MSQVQAQQGEEALLLGVATEIWDGDRYGMLLIPLMERRTSRLVRDD